MENIEFFPIIPQSFRAYSPVAQLVEQTVVSRPVDGSSPFPGSHYSFSPQNAGTIIALDFVVVRSDSERIVVNLDVVPVEQPETVF